MKISKISKTNSQNFNGSETLIINGLNGTLKAADLFIRSQENLSSTRFIQNTTTNWIPKAVFARSKEDLAELSFLEFWESGIFFFAAPLLGEKLYRNGLFKNINKSTEKLIPQSISEINKNKLLSNEIKKKATSKKAGIVLACAAVPIAEYTLSFAKNLFTLKTFNKSNFNNIANLDKTKSEGENLAQQQKVEKHAKRNIKNGILLSIGGLAAGLGLARFGHKSNVLQSLSKGILEPGKALADNIKKLGLKSKKIDKTLGRISLDFANSNGKLALGKGQLGLTALVGLFGYSAAAQDRGRLDVLEVWTRVPLVVFYTIVGSELFDKAFFKILEKKNKYKDLITKDKNGKIHVPKREELPALAAKISKERGSKYEAELKRLLKEKAVIMAVPYAFSLLFMGFSLSAISRIWTQYRYNHQNKTKENKKN